MLVIGSIHEQKSNKCELFSSYKSLDRHNQEDRSPAVFPFCLPGASRGCVDSRRLAYPFIHSDVSEWLPQNPVVDGPRAQTNTVNRFRLAERTALV